MDDLMGYTLGGLGVGGIVIGLVKSLGQRSIDALDKTIAKLDASISELGKVTQNLRETDIIQAQQIGRLDGEVKSLKERVDGQGSYYRDLLHKAAAAKRTK